MGKFKDKLNYGYDYGYSGSYGYGYGYGSYSGGSTNGKVHEAIKTLRSNIKFSGIDNPIKTIVITSSIPGEGKSTISHFLAIEMAKAGNKTLIVECDLRRPTQGNLFKVRPKKGLTKYLSGDCTLEEAAAVTNTENLYFLDVDSKVVNPVEMLGSERFKKAMEEMREKFDIVIFDTLPLASFIEGALVAANADATIVVVRAGYTPQRAIVGSLDQLEKANANVIGTVLNGIEETASGQYYGYYKYRKNSRYGKYNYDSYDSYYAEIEKQEAAAKDEENNNASDTDDFSDLMV
ncbi:MAG: CpsD/CapB family tyrosine-protein kinase [Clostridia bacterium]|nr:CpsD/CapB family tyrosine-protein kinase [Clostridia bacterium]